jgi:hypothetical protein
MAEIYRRRNKRTEAIQTARRWNNAIRLWTHHAGANLSGAKKPDLAKSELERALKIAPNYRKHGSWNAQSERRKRHTMK